MSFGSEIHAAIHSCSRAPPVRASNRSRRTHSFITARAFQRAQIVDYSLGGLQLEGTFGLIKRDTVQVELISGVRISANVAWSLGTHTGIVFSEPLPASHPAMLELDRRHAKRSPGNSIQLLQDRAGVLGRAGDSRLAVT